METDVVLRAPDRVIIDTKFYRHTLQRRSDTEKFRSAHLHQMFAYLKDAEAEDGSYQRAEGLLLYPTVGRPLDEAFEIEGHWLHLCTVDLAQRWPAIHDDLLRMIEKPRSAVLNPRL